MLYGRTNPNQSWEFKRISTEPAILYNENSKVIPIPGLFENLKEKSDSGLFFYVYSLFKKERFIFVTTQKVDFLALNNPENMPFSGICVYVRGALWDIEKSQFVDFNGAEGEFKEFVLYDAGIPNIVLDRSKKQYTIFAIKDDEYLFYENVEGYQPTAISHVWKNGKVGRPINNRIIFITSNENDAESMLILHEEVEFDSLNEYVSFVESIPLNMETDSDEAYFRIVHGKNAVGHNLEDADLFDVKHLVSDDAFVVKQPYDEYCICFIDNGNVIFDEEYDCVDYDKMVPTDEFNRQKRCSENIVWVSYKINDFENREATFNITTGKIAW